MLIGYAQANGLVKQKGGRAGAEVLGVPTGYTMQDLRHDRPRIRSGALELDFGLRVISSRLYRPSCTPTPLHGAWASLYNSAKMLFPQGQVSWVTSSTTTA